MSAPVVRYSVSAGMLASGIAGSVNLLSARMVGEATFATLIAMCLFAAAIIVFSDRLREFDVTQMRVVLSEIKDTQRDIADRETRIKDLAHRVADLVEAATDGAIVTDRHDAAKFQKALARVREL